MNDKFVDNIIAWYIYRKPKKIGFHCVNEACTIKNLSTRGVLDCDEKWEKYEIKYNVYRIVKALSLYLMTQD